MHSLAGCFLYGAFVAEVVVVRHRRWSGWALPLAGGRARHGDRPGLVPGGVLVPERPPGARPVGGRRRIGAVVGHYRQWSQLANPPPSRGAR
ncbi:DUF6529 family protein [Streptomyces cynarae]|uniref:DUF6529 family protein n=1 Tax=Streptomyces cynarae TaxID=2981134 RepID=A0ABY6EDS6_9ACTN|nr:DUF6529 family protein [Streptomyces cynarae]UXY24804.1 DUF6529 family protein [Streptomyces cynarae]